MQTFEEWYKEQIENGAHPTAWTAWNAALASQAAEMKITKGLASNRLAELAELLRKYDVLRKRIDAAKWLTVKWRKDYKVPPYWCGTTFVSDTVDALADQLLAALGRVELEKRTEE